MRQQYHFRKQEGDVFIWDVNRLLDQYQYLPQRAWRLSEISEIDENYWFELGGAQPSCRAISEHAKLINEADLTYPILLCSEGKIIDGMHRVCKALMRGDTHIQVKQIPDKLAPHFINIEAQDLAYD
ncbi:hypothetical protein DBZ36_10495 [Alginatibacterium sediminis]|uniref:Chromosome partitioning protein ParB n=1 Tax=Alginatibacterium sediminis TaxID=2164068 RepID=A0A420EDV2_9ALTE|nr:hypothetical protein [Alginatibacterium sediminis]RKF18812.1 hypothetical protein DBZ36_10495 [Alginatibacterium sediminis]